MMKIAWSVRWNRSVLFFTVAILVCGLCEGCTSAPKARNRGGWYILRWIEKNPAHGRSEAVKPEDRAEFNLMFSYDKDVDLAAFEEKKARIREGDLVAFRMEPGEARKKIATGGVGKLCYRICEYGHLAIAARSPSVTNELRVFSSEAFKGPTDRETLDKLKDQCWDVYRLDKWNRVNPRRLDEFVKLSMAKAGHWRGYDFSGIFGLWNSNLRPSTPEQIGHDYICSTIVVAALYYCGVELDGITRHALEIVTPKEVVTSKARLIPVPQITIEVLGTAPGAESPSPPMGNHSNAVPSSTSTPALVPNTP